MSKKIEVKLRTDGTYRGMEDFNYSTILTVSDNEEGRVWIPRSELIRGGASSSFFPVEGEIRGGYCFTKGEYELIQEETENED